VLFLPAGTKAKLHRADLPSYFDTVRGGVFGRRASGIHHRSGYDVWYPVGTRVFEVLAFGETKANPLVFEVRSRTKMEEGRWNVNVYRPFTQATFAGVVLGYSPGPLVPWERRSGRVNPAYEASGHTEVIPPLRSASERDAMMRGRVFRSVLDRGWSADVPCPTSRADNAIVPRGYDGAIVGATRASCQRCHQDAGIAVRFFSPNSEWYGFVRGSRREQLLGAGPDLFVHPGSKNGSRVFTRGDLKDFWEWTDSPPPMPVREQHPVLGKFEKVIKVSDAQPAKLPVQSGAAGRPCPT